MCCTARTKAPSDSPDQSSNAPLITQEVRRRHSYFITLINSLSDTAAINPPFFPAAELQGGGWLMRMRSPLYMCGEIPRKWAPLTAGDWLGRSVSGYQFALGGERGSGGSHISCSVSKGNLREWGEDMDRWCRKVICDVTHTAHAHTPTKSLFVWSLWGGVTFFWFRNLKENNKKKCWFKCFWASNELLKSRQCGNITNYRSNTIWNRGVMHPSNFF